MVSFPVEEDASARPVSWYFAETLRYYTPVAIAGLHLATATVLSGTIGLDLYRAGRQLGLSQSPAVLVRRRSKLLPTFVALAGLSLLLAVFAGLSHAKLSYQTWADGRGIGVPNRFVLLFFSLSRLGRFAQLSAKRNNTSASLRDYGWPMIVRPAFN